MTQARDLAGEARKDFQALVSRLTAREGMERLKPAFEAVEKKIKIALACLGEWDDSDKGVMGELYSMLAFLFNWRQQTSLAIDNFEKALKFFRDVSDERGEAETCLRLAWCHLRQSHWHNAEYFSRQAAAICRKLGDSSFTKQAEEALAQADEGIRRLNS